MPDSVLARAIALVGAERTGTRWPRLCDWGDVASNDDVRNRIARLDARPLSTVAKAAVVAAAVALLIVPTALLFAPGVARLVP